MFRKVVLVLLAGAVLLGAQGVVAGPEVGVRGGNRDRVPVISVKDFDLQRFEGKVVLVGVWQATACESCEAYISWLTEMQDLYGQEGFIVVAVNQDPESSAATDLLNNIHKRSLVVLDPTGKMGTSLQVEGLPGTYLYDRNLNLTDRFTGFVKEETGPLEKAVQKLIKKKYKD